MRTTLFAAVSISAMIAMTPAPAAALSQPPAEGTVGPQEQADPDDNRAGQDDAETGNVIIVTASRRRERLQDVPSAVTAFDGRTLETIGAQNFRDYVGLIPGLSQRDLGNPGQGTIIIRGLNTGPQSITNTTATYIDEAPFSASGFLSAAAILTPDPDIADLDRIEVLKGPQGTLYGANSLGGLVRIITARPDASRAFGRAWGEVSTVEGGSVGYSARGSINVPIVPDVLAIRANGVYRLAPGWTDNVTLGTEDVNESIIRGGRLALRFTPTDRLTVDLGGIYQEIENRGNARQDNITGTLQPRDREYSYRALVNAESNLTYKLLNGSVDYDFGRVSLIGTASYGEYQTDQFSDASETFVPTLRAIGLAAIIPATAQVIGDISPNLEKFTAEVRLVSERIGAFEFVLGGFYTDESNVYRANYFVNNAQGVPLAAPFNVLVRTTTLNDYKESAAFGNLTFYLTDDFDITGGVRFAQNEQVAQTGGPGAVVFYAPRATANFTFEDNVTTYLATLRWRPSRDVSTFLRAASGYRPGGPQNNPAPPAGAQTEIRPDETWNYEAGVRAQLFDNRLSLGASIYHIDWSDIQLNTNFMGVVLQANGGEAKVDGAELELAFRPSPGLTLATNVGYTDARLARVDPGVTTSVGARAGDALPLTPKFTLAMIGDYRMPLGESTNLNLGATFRHRSKMPSSYPGSILNPNIEVPSATTIDLRAGVDFRNFTIQVRADNVFDELVYTTLATNYLVTPAIPVPTTATVARPRTLTLAVSARF
ncbi:MAG TPA: TonB-dependent receptor [Allosphingosinicella sp.]|nr:TonB-dependent receptor [Allosphingosinicella sp.]